MSVSLAAVDGISRAKSGQDAGEARHKISSAGCRNSLQSERHCRERRKLPATTRKETSMQYLLLIYTNENAMLNAPKEAATQMISAYQAYTEAMTKAGVRVGSNRLRPTSDATTVRAPNGKASVLNGPFAETKEQLAGYYLIDAPDLDAALSWAKRCPGATYGWIEVRPVWSA
jgi:hypothetical protein